jgi:hypothetical protein
MFRISSLSFFSLSILLPFTACRARDGGDADAVEQAADSSHASQAEATLLASAIEGSATATVTPATPESAAAFIAARAPQRYAPSGCVTVTQSGLTVTLDLAGCTGPRGLRELDGRLVLEVSAGAGGAIVVDASAADFQIGAATLDIDATATYGVDGGTSSLAVVTRTAGVGPLGHAIAHEGDYTATWDGRCLTIDGAWSTERGDASRSTSADVTRCLDECPTGAVTRTTVNQRVIELTFDGTDTARWSTSAGGSGSFSLVCGF